MKKLLSIVLACAMICSIFVMPVSVSAAVGTRVNFPIGVATGANSKLFIEYYGNSGKDTKDSVYYTGIPGEGDWVPGLDYNSSIAKNGSYYYPTGDYTTDVNNLYTYKYGTGVTTSRVGAIVYEIDADTDNSTKATPKFETRDDGIVWVVNGTDYYVNPTDKAIQLMTSVKLDDLKVPELEDDFNSLAGVTLDVPDGNYSSIGFLAAAPTTAHKLKVTPVYKDGAGTEITTNAFKEAPISTTTGVAVNARAFSDILSTGAWSNLALTYKPVTIEGIDSSRVLDKVIVKSSGAVYPITIVSAWGNGNKLAEEPAATFEVTEAGYADGEVTVTYANAPAAGENVQVIVAEYTDANESSLANVQIIPAKLEAGKTEFTKTVSTSSAAKVKVFVWKDLTDFFPYK